MAKSTLTGSTPLWAGSPTSPNRFTYPWKWGKWTMRILFAFVHEDAVARIRSAIETRSFKWAELEVDKDEGTGVLRYELNDGTQGNDSMMDLAIQQELSNLPSLSPRPLSIPKTKEPEPRQDVGGSFGR